MVSRADYVQALQTEKAFVQSRGELPDAERSRRLRDIDDELAQFDPAPARVAGRKPETA